MIRSVRNVIPILLLVISTEAIKLQQGLPVVKSVEGELRGQVLKSWGGRDFYSFRGIKYGEISERFGLSQPVKPWAGVRDASDYGARCPGFGIFVRKVLGDTEDCLYLNVHVPAPGGQTKTGLPVMVFIHGGGFVDGTSGEYGPDFFMDQDVILVTINYRLAILGFLNTEDGTVPANNGLKDMILALKWVQRNIESFGGDRNKVTIFGESAGAASVHYLTLSPAAKGLFQSAIAQSGSAFCPWAHSSSPLEEARRVAEHVKCPTVSTKEMVDCLRKVDLQELIAVEAAPRQSATIAFSPSLEVVPADSSDYLAVPATPYELATSSNYDNSKDVPLVIGVNENEGWLYSAVLLGNAAQSDEFNKNWGAALLGALDYLPRIPSENIQSVATKLTQLYGADKVDLTSKSTVDFLSDIVFNRGVQLAAELHAAGDHAKVYSYMLTHNGGYSFALFTGSPRDGVTHADELQYLFHPMSCSNLTWPALQRHSLDEDFARKLVSLWTSFAATRTPQLSSWESLSSSGSKNQDYPLMVLNLDPELKKDSLVYKRVVGMDSLLAPYDKIQVSWRTIRKNFRDEL